MPSYDAPAITWLHLSDIHLCEPRTGWDVHRVLESILPDLREMEGVHGLHPDLIFFTGDAAFGQLGNENGKRITDQFQEAHGFLERIRTEFSHPVGTENLFLVPGNHDVNRDAVTKALTEYLDRLRSVDPVRQMIQQAGKEWKQYMERLAEYRDFISTKYTHLYTDPSRLVYNVTREIKGIQLGIAGLNTAWSCGRSGEQARLWMGGDWQLGNAMRELSGCDCRVALMHHPSNWLGEHESGLASRDLERDFHFLLHGHEHHGWVRCIDNRHVRVAAAACYDRSDKENGYNFVRWWPTTGQVEIWLRRYDRDGGGWIPRIVAGRTDNNGMWSCEFSSPSTPKIRPRAPISGESTSTEDTTHDPAFIEFVEMRLRQTIKSFPTTEINTFGRILDCEECEPDLIANHAVTADLEGLFTQLGLAVKDEQSEFGRLGKETALKVMNDLVLLALNPTVERRLSRAWRLDAPKLGYSEPHQEVGPSGDDGIKWALKAAARDDSTGTKKIEFVRTILRSDGRAIGLESGSEPEDAYLDIEKAYAASTDIGLSDYSRAKAARQRWQSAQGKPALAFVPKQDYQAKQLERLASEFPCLLVVILDSLSDPVCRYDEYYLREIISDIEGHIEPEPTQ